MLFKPAIYNVKVLADFQPYYWDVKELKILCKRFGLPKQGLKKELIEPIALFLQHGTRAKTYKQTTSSGLKDSDQIITRATPVVNYRNDANTRAFFVQEIGPHFRFNTYLRQFAKIPNQDTSLTYGDLVNGWLDEEAKKKWSRKRPIGSPFSYNQFQRDYFTAEPNKTRKQCLAAWNLVRSVAGPTTYANFRRLRDEELIDPHLDC